MRQARSMITCTGPRGKGKYHGRGDIPILYVLLIIRALETSSINDGLILCLVSWTKTLPHDVNMSLGPLVLSVCMCVCVCVSGNHGKNTHF